MASRRRPSAQPQANSAASASAIGSGSAERASGSPTWFESSAINPWSAVASQRPTGAIAYAQATRATKPRKQIAAASSGPLAVRRMPKP